MYRIIGGDGREYGPVTGDTIRQWVLQNRANSKTLVRADDSADWRPLGEIPEFAGSFGAPPPHAPDAPPLQAAPVAPVAPAAGPLPAPSADAIAEGAAAFSIGDCLGGGFRVLGINYWQAVGVTFLVMLCMVVAQFIPFVGILASLLLTQVFNAGLYFYFVKLSRGDATAVGDGFSGFSIAFGQLVLLSLVVNLLVAVVLLPVALPIVGMVLWNWNPWVMTPLAIVLALPVIYLSVSWTFASILIVDRGLEFWDAMEMSRKAVTKCWFRLFFVVLIAGIVASLGIIGLGIGIVFTMPIMGATVAVAYESLFGRE